MSTCHRLDLQILGSQPIVMPKISLITGHPWQGVFAHLFYKKCHPKSYVAVVT